MSVNINTLNQLYNNGILDYVPYDLVGNSPNVSALIPAQNTYLNTAMQGQLYQQYGAGNDSLTISSQGYGVSPDIGIDSNAGLNGFGVSGIGTQSNAGLNGFGLNGIGAQSNAGLNGFGIGGVGSQATSGLNQSGFGDVKNGFLKVSDVYQKTPSFIKGLLSGAVILGTLTLCIKRHKANKVIKNQEKSFSKWNPMNWIKRKNK